MDKRVFRLAIVTIISAFILVMVIVYATNAKKINQLIGGSKNEGATETSLEGTEADNPEAAAEGTTTYEDQIGDNLNGFLTDADFFDETEQVPSLVIVRRSSSDGTDSVSDYVKQPGNSDGSDGVGGSDGSVGNVGEGGINGTSGDGNGTTGDGGIGGINGDGIKGTGVGTAANYNNTDGTGGSAQGVGGTSGTTVGTGITDDASAGVGGDASVTNSVDDGISDAASDDSTQMQGTGMAVVGQLINPNPEGTAVMDTAPEGVANAGVQDGSAGAGLQNNSTGTQGTLPDSSGYLTTVPEAPPGGFGEYIPADQVVGDTTVGN